MLTNRFFPMHDPFFFIDVTSAAMISIKFFYNFSALDFP